MKKLYSISVFTFLIIASCISGCKKDSESSAGQLVGTWNLISTTRVDYYDNVKLAENTTTYDPGKIVLKMYDDGTAQKYTNDIISDAFYWTIEGNLLIMTNNNGVIQTVEYAVNGADLTIKWAIETNSDGHMARSEYMNIYKKA